MTSSITSASEPVTLYEAHIAHMDALRRMRRSPAAFKMYRLYVVGFITFLEDHGVRPTLETLTPTRVGDYQDWIRGHVKGTRGGAAAELMAVTMLKAFATWCWRARLPSASRAPLSGQRAAVRASRRRGVPARSAGPPRRANAAHVRDDLE